MRQTNPITFCGKIRTDKSKGFTLLEILIALAILSISMLALYNLMNFSLDLFSYSKNRREVVSTGYEAVLKQLNFNENLNNIKNQNENIEFNLETRITLIPNIQENFLKIENKESSVTYRYFNETN